MSTPLRCKTGLTEVVGMVDQKVWWMWEMSFYKPSPLHLPSQPCLFKLPPDLSASICGLLPMSFSTNFATSVKLMDSLFSEFPSFFLFFMVILLVFYNIRLNSFTYSLYYTVRLNRHVRQQNCELIVGRVYDFVC